MNDVSKQRGLAVIEFLLIAIVVVLVAGIIMIIVLPKQNIRDSRDEKRRSDATTLIDALQQYSVDHEGNFPDGLDNDFQKVQVIGNASSSCENICASAASSVSTCLDLGKDLVPNYLAFAPIDPLFGNEEKTGYYVNKNENNNIFIGVCHSEKGNIEVSR